MLALAALATTASATIVVDQFPQSTLRKGIAPIPSPAKPVCTSNLLGKCYAYKPQTCLKGYYLSKQKYGTPKAHRCFAGVRITARVAASVKLHCTKPLGNYMNVVRGYHVGQGNCTYTFGDLQGKGFPSKIPLYDPGTGRPTSWYSKHQYCSIYMVCPGKTTSNAQNVKLHSVCIWRATSAKMYTKINYELGMDGTFLSQFLSGKGWSYTTSPLPGSNQLMSIKPFINTQDYPPYILGAYCSSYLTTNGEPMNSTGERMGNQRMFAALLTGFSYIMGTLTTM